MKGQRKQETGTDMKLFLGLDYESEAFMDLKSSRSDPEYEQLTVTEIKNRIQEDIQELVARAYPAHGEEWAKKFPADSWRWRQTDCSPCGQVTEKLANQLRFGLWKEIKSTDSAVAMEAQKEFHLLWRKHYEAEPKHAASVVALVTTQAATWLEHLFEKRATMMKEVARKCSLWPVNLSIRRKMFNRGGKRETVKVITRRDFAEKYLKGLEVNEQSQWRGTAYSGAEKRSPFRVAAMSLHTDLLIMKISPHIGLRKTAKGGRAWARLTPWAKELIALPNQMTTDNVGRWWKVAKILLDEQWRLRREAFEPLIAVCKMTKLVHESKTPYGAGSSRPKHVKRKVPIANASLYEAEMRSVVINLRLKEAFWALAKPADL